MATASMKPFLLLSSRCRLGLQTPMTIHTSGWRMAATANRNDFRRTLSSSGGRGGSDDGSGGFRLPRPEGAGPSIRRPDGRRSDGRRDDQGPKKRPSRRGGKDDGGKFEYGGSSITAIPDNMRPTGPTLRTHMINLFPGEFRDDKPGDEKKTVSKDEAEDFSEMERLMAKLNKRAVEYEAKKQRWLENSKPQVRVPIIDSVGRSYGRGARKTAQARVWITPGFGEVTVNRMDFLDYFPRLSDREMILDPLVATRTCCKFDLQCQVRGGGKTGQAGAIRLGVARALQNWNPTAYRPPLKAMGYLTRDARKVERKKVGLLKARKSPQWNRR